MELKPEKWINIIKNSVFPGKDRGSTTKIVYIWAGVGGAVSAFMLSLGMLVYYLWRGACDPTYATACGGLWIAVFGFATQAQNHKASTDSKANAGPETGN